MSKLIPKLYIPPGTLFVTIGSSVTIHFPTEIEAEAFMRFMEWLENANDGELLQTSRPKETTH